MENTGGLNIPLFGFLILAWILCFFMVCRGAKVEFKKSVFQNRLSADRKILNIKKVHRQSGICNSYISNNYFDGTCYQRYHTAWRWNRVKILFDATMGHACQSWGRFSKRCSLLISDWLSHLVSINLKTLVRPGWQQPDRFFSHMQYVKDHWLHSDLITNGHLTQWNGLQN